MLEEVLSRAYLWLTIWDGSSLLPEMRPEAYLHGGKPLKQASMRRR